MLFDFTDDQVSFARSVEALLAPAATPQGLREAWESGDHSRFYPYAEPSRIEHVGA